MKRTKTWKWRIGAVGMTGIALLFQHVKASPAFTAAVEKSKAPTVPALEAGSVQDKVMEKWYGQTQADTNRNSAAPPRSPGYRGADRPGAGSGGSQDRPSQDSQLQQPTDVNPSFDGSASITRKRTRTRHS